MNSFPILTFPERSLTFGTRANVCSLGSSDFCVASTSSHTKFHRVRKSLQLTARCRLWRPRPYEKDLKETAASMAEYFEANYYQSFIPRELLMNYLSRDLVFSHEWIDESAGNSLYFFSSPQRRVLVYPSGACFELVNFSFFIDEFNPCEPPTSFKVSTPIRQIVGLCDNGSLTDLVAVRTWTQVSFFKLNCKDAKVQKISQHFFPCEVSDVAFNRSIPGQVAIILVDGTVYIWDNEKEESSRFVELLCDKYRLEKIFTPDQVFSAWRTCCFGAHPRVLMMATRDTIDLLNLIDCSIINLKTFTEEAEEICSIACHPVNRFQICVATSLHTYLFDSRQTHKPLLKWAYQSHRDPPSSMVMIPVESSKTILAVFGRIWGDIMIYIYESHPSLPPRSVSVQNLKHDKTAITHTYAKVTLLEDLKHTAVERENEKFPRWPELLGVAFNLAESGFLSMYALMEDGAIYRDLLAPENANSTLLDIPDIIYSFESTEEEIYGKEEQEKDAIKSHFLYDAKYLMQDLQTELEWNANIESNNIEHDFQTSLDLGVSHLRDTIGYQTLFDIYEIETFKPLIYDEQGEIISSRRNPDSNVATPAYQNALGDANIRENHTRIGTIDLRPFLRSLAPGLDAQFYDPQTRFCHELVERRYQLASILHTGHDSFEEMVQDEPDEQEELHLRVSYSQKRIVLPAICGDFRKKWLELNGSTESFPSPIVQHAKTKRPHSAISPEGPSSSYSQRAGRAAVVESSQQSQRSQFSAFESLRGLESSQQSQNSHSSSAAFGSAFATLSQQSSASTKKKKDKSRKKGF